VRFRKNFEKVYNGGIKIVKNLKNLAKNLRKIEIK
jgi:hypothetical protein